MVARPPHVARKLLSRLVPPVSRDEILAEQSPAIEEIAFFFESTIGPMTEVDRPEHVLMAPASWNSFSMLGVDAALGRTFVADDGVPVDQNTQIVPPVSAVISHAFWQRSFGGDPDVLGTVVHIWGGTTEIVGVLPDRFRMLLPPELNISPNVDIWRAVRWDPINSSREGRFYRSIARLADGASLRQASQQADAFSARIRDQHLHHAAEDTQLRVRSFEASTEAPLRAPLTLLMGAVTLVLLIACANVANLLLARGTARAGEMAVRSCLGAGGTRLVRQLLTESAVLALFGAAAGVALATFGVRLLHAIRPNDLHGLQDVSLDLPVLLFTVLLAMVATVLSGLLPAYHTARSGPAGHFKVRGGTGVAKRSRTVLVVTEVALSVMLLVGAGLLIRTFGELQRMPLGFEPDQLLTVTATQSSRPREERQAFEAELIRAVEEVPGVTAAGIVFPLPMNGVYERSAEYAMDGREADPTAWTTVYFRTVSPTYFEAMGLELRRGRHFTTADETYDVPIVILDERLAEREFGGSDPVGAPFWVRGMEGDTLLAEVVGVVEHAPQGDHRDTRPTMYFPRVFYQSHEVSVVARVAGDPAGVGATLSAAIRNVDPGFPSDLTPMSSYVREQLAQSRFLLILMEIFGGLALMLAAVGLYGVLSYSVRQRTRELGLRLALGAERGSLTGGVVWSGARLAAAGIGIGLVGSVALGRALQAQLFRVDAADPLTLAGTAAVVILVAVVASLLPAVRASRVAPAVALQED